MSTTHPKIRLLPACCLLSILCHIVSVYALGLFGSYHFRAAVNNPAAVTVDLAAIADPAAVPKPASEGPAEQPRPAADSLRPALAEAQKIEKVGEQMLESPSAEPKAVALKELGEKVASAGVQPASETSEPEAAEAGAQEKGGNEKPAPAKAEAAASANPATAKGPATALAAVSNALASKYERLSYRITLHGIPVATAELEAKNEQGMTTITMKVRSNAAISSVFPVDDLVQTQQIGGLYVMAKIKQREGNFRSDETFTINLRKKTVTWFDLVNPRILKTTVPTADVLDSLSGIYYLRNRDLQVGKTETMHIFDSETYAEVPVEVLRREEVRLPNLSKVQTLVVRPLQKTAGIFRRTGDVLMWLTDDAAKVPVRIETSMALGKVTAELVDAESEPHAAEQTAEAR